ncbi:hypothetical protein KTO58_26100 [Chitinophaga pendula]|uniref:hypothetical protein n=1 Tax=Chitinophaga TaxID=79328 RepID=UPI000BB04182|nr:MULTISPECIES: hypothetical protein [Chitinophaga]ASZ09958.1 hypothetical protein CK934_02670 [Chitinophaga sp. MD30]UCJ07100.1 hypothetical protein KTO58_26100 [Chitinophaga pendula]
MKTYLFFPWLLVLILLMENKQLKRKIQRGIPPATTNNCTAAKRPVPTRIVFIRRLMGPPATNHPTNTPNTSKLCKR